MSGTGNDKPTAGQQQPYFPPPPPGPPPSGTQSQGAYQQPSFAPPSAQGQALPTFAPPPAEELYDEPPTQYHQQQPQQPPPRPTSSSGRHSHGFGFSKLSSTLAGLGAGGAGSNQGHTQGHGQHNAPAKAEGWGEKLSAFGLKAAEQVGGSINQLANKVGSEAFLPDSLDKECDKAARILRSFCKDGIYTEGAGAPPLTPRADGEVKSKPANSKTLLTIPSKVISRAVGLAIFTTVRAGFQVSGSTGSGVLVARLPDGRWSPPSGIQIHSLGAGFLVGLDIYDCVVVINNREALEAFTRTRMSLGPDLAVTAGPWGAGGSVDVTMPPPSEDKKKGKGPEKDSSGGFAGGPAPAAQPQSTTGVETAKIPATSAPGTRPQQQPGKGDSRQRKPSPFRSMIEKPVFSYVKSRGFYAGVQIDGTVVMERKEANAAFYGAPISVAKIITGEVPLGPWEPHIQVLLDVISGAERGWHGHGHAQQPQQQQPSPQQYQPAPGADVGSTTESMQHMSLGTGPGGSSGASPGSYSYPPPPPHQLTTTEAGGSGAGTSYYPPPPPMTKEQEAAAHTQAPVGPPPPMYSEPAPPSDELPPSYEDDGRPHPGVGDSKTGQH